jgi:hypothetical protein|tara:strand:+ start:120 stop:515 length:396 start_codon:yes stop_codon:yes gene_type:complete
MKLLSKGSKLYSILFNKCPKCHTSNFWASDNPFKNMFFSTENSCKTCENCSLDYELEIGFWYGSMYVSYAISVAVMLLFWSLTTFLFSTITTFNEILIIVIAIILVSPLNYHVSRLIWINFFVKYIPNDNN